MLMFYLLLANLTFCNSCDVFKAESIKSKIKVVGEGLHKRIHFFTYFQTQFRMSQCQILYKLKIPKAGYIDEIKFKKTSPAYDLISTFSKASGLRTIYLIRKSRFLSTFEIKDFLQYELYIKPPKKDETNVLNIDAPLVAINCNNMDIDLKKCTEFSDEIGLPSISPNNRWILLRIPNETLRIHTVGLQKHFVESQFFIFSFFFLTLICSFQFLLH